MININSIYSYDKAKYADLKSMFIKRSTRILDDLILKFYPTLFIAFVEKVASEH